MIDFDLLWTRDDWLSYVNHNRIQHPVSGFLVLPLWLHRKVTSSRIQSTSNFIIKQLFHCEYSTDSGKLKNKIHRHSTEKHAGGICFAVSSTPEANSKKGEFFVHLRCNRWGKLHDFCESPLNITPPRHHHFLSVNFHWCHGVFLDLEVMAHRW